jgi:catechol 2,3-dioxygenase-like lactoylglutathione lyase family enzyme
MPVKLEFFGPSARLHHVGMAVRSIEDAVPGLQSIEDPIQSVHVAFADIAGLTIELIEPAGEHSPIDQSLKKGIKLLHLCIEVPSLELALEHCRKHGFRRISVPQPAVAFDMQRIVWVFNTTFGLVELLEAKAV